VASRASDERLLLILGARSFAPEVAGLVSETTGYRLVGFVENVDRERCSERLDGLPIIWVDELSSFGGTHWAICALGSTKRAQLIDHAADCGLRFATIVHPGAHVAPTSSIGEGSIVNAGAVVAHHSCVGRHVIVNRGALLGHHTKIGDYATIGPGANIAAACLIGNRTYVGMGAIVLDHVTIGSHAVVGAGALVTKDVPDHAQVVGSPARVVKRNIDGF
jgi:acetyltransferase EpsM